MCKDLCDVLAWILWVNVQEWSSWVIWQNYEFLKASILIFEVVGVVYIPASTV